MLLKEVIRSCYPNIPILRKILSKLKIRQYYRYVMPEKDIEAGERDAEQKKQLVNEYAAKWPKYAADVDEKINELVSKVSAYKDRDDLSSIKTDMRFCRFAYGFQPDEYLGFSLEKRNMEERRAFISDIDRYRYAVKMNDVVDFVIYMDKSSTYKKFEQYYKRKAVTVNKENDYEKFESFVKEQPVFVQKRVDLSRGDSVSLINLPSVLKERNITQKEYFSQLISEGKYILEERVVQSKEMAALNPSSVNTVRCSTFHTRNGYKVMWTFMKIGQGGAFVDNGGAGGILVGIDKETGIFNTDGIDEFGKVYKSHPDTGVVFVGYQLPEWSNMIKLCQELSAKTPSVKYVSWDMAYTDAGWIAIEGNGMAQMIGPQMVWQRGFKEEVESVMKEMDLLA